MASKKIIVPQGLINPNETTIIEIPAGVDSEATLIARSSPRTCQDFQPGFTSTPRTRRVTTAPPQRPPANAGSGRQVRQVTSTTIISNDDSSLGILDPSYMNSTQSSGCPQSTLGVLGSGYMDSTRMGNSSRNQTMGILGSGYMDSSRQTASTLGVLGSGYMDSTRNTTQSTMGCLGSGYMDSTRATNSTLGVLGSGYMDSTRSASPSPRRIKKIVKKVVTESPQNSQNDSTLGILPPGYMDNTNLCGRSMGNESKKKVTRVTSETIIDEGSDTPGILGAGYFDSTQSSGSMGVLGSGYMDSTQGSPGCPSKRGKKCPGAGSASGNRSQGGANTTQQNLTQEVQRHLTELEQNERNQINQDLMLFQQARRRLVHDATNISSSGESQLNFTNKRNA